MKNKTNKRPSRKTAKPSPPVKWKAHLNSSLIPGIPGHIIRTDDDVQRPIALIWEGGGTHGKQYAIETAHHLAANPELLEATTRLLAFAREVMPQMKHIVLQDYENLNLGMVAAEQGIAKANQK